jgi:hypothetical protein
VILVAQAAILGALLSTGALVSTDAASSGAETLAGGAPPNAATASLGPEALVLGRRAGNLAVGLEVRRGDAPSRTELAATVLGPDGSLAGGLGVRFRAGAAAAKATPCGAGRYCATLATDLPATVDVRVAKRGSAERDARFAVPGSWRPAPELVRRATAVYHGLRSVAYDESLSAGGAEVVRTRWRMQAPDRLAYDIADGPSAVVIGSRRWDRKPGGRWLASPQEPLQLPAPPWTSSVRQPAVTGSTSVDGHPVWVVSFLDQAGLPTWFTLWIDKRTSRTLRLRMTTASHFMRQTYTSFDDLSPIEPPR